MSQIEFIMEIQGSFSESWTNGLMKGQSWFNQTWHLFLHLWFEIFQVTLQESIIDYEQRLVIRHTDRNQPEMSLISRINKEWSSSWVHTGQMLAINNFLDGQFSNIIPMLIISMLSQKSDWGLSVVRVQLRHIEIIDVIDHFYFSSRAVLLTSQFFQRGF